MKAERRHELKSNALARGIENFPQMWRQHGNKLMLALIAILLVNILIRYRLSESALRESTAKVALAKGEAELAQIRNIPFWLSDNQEAIANTFSQQAGTAEDDINDALKSADDAGVRARAYVARGDLNLLWAGFPILPAATTRPALAPAHSREDYLTIAENAHKEVLNEPLARNRQAVSSALLGLAAVAENRSGWDAARRNYEAILNDSGAPAAMKDYARQREEMLAELSKKPFLGSPTTEGILPSSQPSILGPAVPKIDPTAAPSTSLPSPPANSPSSQPTTSPGIAPTTQKQ